MLIEARNSLLFACLGIVGMIFLMLFVSDGPAAIGAIAGAPEDEVSVSTLRLALMLDTILPVGYGAGFVFFALGLVRDDETKLLALAIILFTLAGVTMDFIENGIVLANADGRETEFVFATVGKYGLLGLVGVLIGNMLTPGLPSTAIASPVFKYISPVALALLMSDLAGPISVWFFGPGLLGTFLLAAWVANREAEAI